MLEKMLEKKNFIINCDICDARKVQEESLYGYDNIIINADLILLDDRSREIFNRFPTVCNTDAFLDCEGMVETVVQNEDFEICGNAPVRENTFLVANGNLLIRPGSEAELTSYQKIIVNGDLFYPRSLASCLNRISINGERYCYPDESRILKDEFEIEEYFPIRARENGSYFVAKTLSLTNPKVEIQPLLDKKVQFFTKKFLVLEEKLPEAALLVEEDTELEKIPKGFVYLQGNQEFSESLVKKYGKHLYIRGNLTVSLEKEAALKELEGLIVKGELFLPSSLKPFLDELGAEYDSLKLLQGQIISGKQKMSISKKILECMPEGISVCKCLSVKIKEDVEPEMIMEKVRLFQCVKVVCSPEQKEAVELVSQDVVKIQTREGREAEGGSKKKENLLEMMGNLAGTKVVNTDKYVL
jgi:hypothetical protein